MNDFRVDTTLRGLIAGQILTRDASAQVQRTMRS
jgi:hypothetical protein